MAIGDLWQQFKEQETIDYRLVLAIPVILVVGVVVLAFTRGVGGSGSENRVGPAFEDNTYICHFDQTEVKATGEELWTLSKNGDAIMISPSGGTPTRLRCTKCNRMSCFMPDPETGEPIEVDDSWDLSEDAQPESTTRDAVSR